MDQDETWQGGRPRPRPHYVRWGPSCPFPEKGHSPQFSAHVCCGQTDTWIKMPLGGQVGLGPGHIVLDGDPAPHRKGAQQPPPLFRPCLLWPNGLMDQYASWYGGRPLPRPHCVRWGPSSPIPRKGQQSPSFRPESIVAKRSPISATAEHLLRLVLFCQLMFTFKRCQSGIVVIEIPTRNTFEATIRNYVSLMCSF